MGKHVLVKISMGKAQNEMGNRPFAPPLVAPLSGLQEYVLFGKSFF
jgi:hypothetical protein